MTLQLLTYHTWKQAIQKCSPCLLNQVETKRNTLTACGILLFVQLRQGLVSRWSALTRPDGFKLHRQSQKDLWVQMAQPTLEEIIYSQKPDVFRRFMEYLWMFLVISTAFSRGIWPLPRGLSESALGFSGATLAVELSSWRVETSLSNNRLTHNIQHIMNMSIRYYFSYRIIIYVHVCLYYILVLLVSSLYPYHVEIEGLSPLHSRSSRSKIGPEGARCMCAYQWHQNDISWAHLMMFSGWKILQTE